MRRKIRQVLRTTGLYPYVQRISDKWNYQNDPEELIYIHIGKCGGVSLWDAINRSSVVKDRFQSISKVHVSKPPILTKSKYLIVVRNPISRAISAFNWRHKLAVEDAVMKDRFKGEHDILIKYGTLNSLAEALYDNGNLNQNVAREFRNIHHLKEDISFYLSDLLAKMKNEQLFALMATENLDADIEQVLGIQSVKRVHENRSGLVKEKTYLSENARENLKKFLAQDYAAIEQLLNMASITDDRRSVLLK